MDTGDVLEVALRVAAEFERLGVAYLVGGSLASSMHGIPRSTQDVDLVAVLHLHHIPLLVGALQDDFYVDAGMVEEAIRRQTSFNVIHLGTMVKVDVFVLASDPVSRLQMERRMSVELRGDPGERLFVASPEDVVLQKLRWYELGGRTSDRQWNDVLGVLKVSGDALDRAYLEDTARRMGLYALLERVLQEAASA